MDRVLILGCGGAGKSTLARQLGERTGLPVIHLDQIWWRPGWVNLSRDEFDRRLEQELAGERWIMDGNFDRTLERRLERADTVVFLDYPVRTCLWGMLRRVFRYRGRSRPDMAEGCPERLDPEFVTWILEFRREVRPRVLQLLAEWDGTVYLFPNRRACGKWLAKLEPNTYALKAPRPMVGALLWPARQKNLVLLPPARYNEPKIKKTLRNPSA